MTSERQSELVNFPVTTGPGTAVVLQKTVAERMKVGGKPGTHTTGAHSVVAVRSGAVSTPHAMEQVMILATTV